MSHRALRIHINVKYLGREAALEGRKSGLARELDDCTVLKSTRRPSIARQSRNSPAKEWSGQGMVRLRLIGLPLISLPLIDLPLIGLAIPAP